MDVNKSDFIRLTCNELIELLVRYENSYIRAREGSFPRMNKQKEAACRIVSYLEKIGYINDENCDIYRNTCELFYDLDNNKL